MIDKTKGKPKNEHDTSQEALMMAIGFGIKELEANRDSTLSTNQKIYLVRRRSNATCVAISSATILCFVAAILLINDLMSRKIGLGVIVTIIGILAITPSILRWYSLLKDVKFNQVIGIQGRVILDLDGSHQYFLRINDLRFEVNKHVFLAFKNGDPYAIYYAPYSKTLLSAEWLRED